MRGRAGRLAGAALVVGLAAACEREPQLTLPAPSDLEGRYGPGAEVRLNGNVIDVRVDQPASQLARGGPLWAKVGPYIFLFSPQTRELLEGFTGVGGVRVRTVDRRGGTVAEALLPRDTLTSVTWPRAIQMAGRARLEGTRRPSYMADLVRFGEAHTRFEYGPRYVNEDG